LPRLALNRALPRLSWGFVSCAALLISGRASGANLQHPSGPLRSLALYPLTGLPKSKDAGFIPPWSITPSEFSSPPTARPPSRDRLTEFSTPSIGIRALAPPQSWGGVGRSRPTPGPPSGSLNPSAVCASARSTALFRAAARSWTVCRRAFPSQGSRTCSQAANSLEVPPPRARRALFDLIAAGFPKPPRTQCFLVHASRVPPPTMDSLFTSRSWLPGCPGSNRP